ncbi:nitroreductase family deazaflavin-dependent oxidoreductase [Nonomuraea soli]|uniref:Deazaflavin-dependent oxidoreductase (Nitroreductase family) n=1 Tax=Nonomuraea soli TaxID=1032476 RepID=A0A7W0CPM6_9ACTN|nr:nitroreductase family deazaflavin-dependent oxidoreductase [Nonomuraea soli]MBA2895002.1 deazaflavin-dependent oxidoreductase (nitroreductase family) [Nonomuraea soli]
MLYGKEHVKRYQETGGAEGHDWNGATVLLLTTTGRRSGEPYTTPVIYQRDGDAHVVVASNGGEPKDPDWYLNLLADPDAEIQVGPDKHHVTARTAEPEEKPQLWGLMTRVWPDYDAYQGKTDRKIPVVVLEPRR